MKNLKIILGLLAMIVISTLILAFNTNTDDSTPGGEIRFYYYVGPDRKYIEPFDPNVDYGCTGGIFECTISSNTPLDGFSFPADADVRVESWRQTR